MLCVYCGVLKELERSWKEYDKLESDVTLAKRNLLDQLEALGSPQVPVQVFRFSITEKICSQLSSYICGVVFTDRTPQSAACADSEGAVEDSGRDGCTEQKQAKEKR